CRASEAHREILDAPHPGDVREHAVDRKPEQLTADGLKIAVPPCEPQKLRRADGRIRSDFVSSRGAIHAASSSIPANTGGLWRTPDYSGQYESQSRNPGGHASESRPILRPFLQALFAAPRARAPAAFGERGQALPVPDAL